MDDAIEEIREKAEVIAEATGRSIESVIADLMDDGLSICQMRTKERIWLSN